ncbi:MAG: DNA mismatch repair protein MutS, partial [Bacteroidota bacterium]
MATSTKKKAAPKETPLMKQYNSIKGKYPDALLLFRVGDFYETFGEDAIKASEILGIVLTKRKNGAAAYVELAGFPHHSLDTYLPKLVRAGNRVAICDQLEDPKQTKTIVKRGVTELVTPGVSFNDQVLDQKSNNFLASVHITNKGVGVAFLDISTGEFIISEGSMESVDKLLQGFQPNEVLFQKQRRVSYEENFGDRFYTFPLEDWAFQLDFANEKLLNHFGTNSLKGFGVERLEMGLIAAGAILQYLEETKHLETSHIRSISRLEQDQYVWLDRFTNRNLEMISSPHPDASTLIDILDHTVSPMGGRMMKRWVVLPLKNLQAIENRLSVVEFFYSNIDKAQEISSDLRKVGDLERLISKASAKRIAPREMLQLGKALELLTPIKEKAKSCKNTELQLLVDQINECEAIRDKIIREIKEDTPLLINKGGVINDDVDPELDEYRSLAYKSKDLLLQIQEREMERTGIPSLKIAFNNVFGYYLEVRNTHKDKVPPEWIRKQTLTQAERYITEELKELETKILSAQEKMVGIETKIYQELVEAIEGFIAPIQANAQVLSKLDCLIAFGNDSRSFAAAFRRRGRASRGREGRAHETQHQGPLRRHGA